jgi:hypothetical protein
VGDTIALDAHASDEFDASLPDSAFVWDVVLEHCPSDCHQHHLATLVGPSQSIDAPDHDYPSWLVVTLTVTDSLGLATTVSVDHIQPRTTTLTAASSPDGLPVTLAGVAGNGSVGPLTVIVGHVTTISAVTSVTRGETTSTFSSWSDGGGLSHAVTAPATPTTYTATYSDVIHDHANTCAGAPVTSSIGGWWHAQFLTAGDVDWYRVKLGSSSGYRFVVGHLPTTAKVELWSGCSTLLATSDAPGTHWEEILRSLPAGTYGLEVIDTGGASTSVYNVRVTKIGSPVGITTTLATVSGNQVRIVGQLYNFSTGYRSATLTAQVYGTTGTLLKTYTFHPMVNPLPPGAREEFLAKIPKPSNYGSVVVHVTSVATTTHPRLLPASGITSTAGPSGTWVVQGTVTNSSSTTATGVRAVTSIYDTNGSIINATPATVGSGTLAPHASATFRATFAALGVGGDRVVGRAA